MVWSNDDVLYSHLFVAVPEMLFEEEIIKYLRRKRLINDESLEFIASLQKDKEALRRIRKRTEGKPAFHRLLAIAPEILNDNVINLLVSAKLVGKNDAALLRVMTGKAKILRGPVDSGTLIQRARRLLGIGHVDEAITLLRSIDAISVKQANKMRAGMLGGQVSFETINSIRAAKSFLEILQLVGSGLVDRRTIQALRVSGLISGRIAESLFAALDYGGAQWQVWEGAKRAEGLAARMAYVVSGSMSFEALEVMKALKILTPEQEVLMLVATKLSQQYNRHLMEEMTERKYRVVPGERPISTYARASGHLDDDLLKLLAQAAEESRVAAKRLHGAARGAEYALRARELHRAMRQVWEGTGYLTIFNERVVADAATSASEEMLKKYYKHMTPFAQTMMEYQARSGIDSYISRKENTLPLSRRVYGNLNVWSKKVDKQISLGLLQGESAEELAKRVTKLINPKVMGGVKYAAMRLGRTELANSFHYTTIRSSREMPWVRGYKWNRSRSHAHTDVCDEYANEDHDGIGEGVFKKANVPGKPHPACLCYLTVVGMNDDEFIKGYNAGRFNAYMNSRVAPVSSNRQRLFNEVFEKAGAFTGQAAAQVALSQGANLAGRMLSNQGVRAPRPTLNALRRAVPRGSTAPSSSPQKKKFFQDTIDVEGYQFKGSNKDLAESIRTTNPDFPGYEKDFSDLTRAERAFNKKGLGPQKARYMGKDAFDAQTYEDILPEEIAPTLASRLYGTKAYQAVNGNLRKSGGDLDKYNDLFGDDGELFLRLQDLRRAERADLFKALEDVIDLSVDADTPETRYNDEVLRMFKDFDMSKYRTHSDVVKNLDSRMMPTSGDRFAYRVTGSDWFGLKPGEELTKDHIGLPFSDNGFTSFEGVKSYYKGSASTLELGADSRRQYRVKAFLPDGTRATRVNDEEWELVTSRGSHFFVMDVLDDKDSPFLKTVHVMLGSQNPLADWGEKILADESSDFWDDIVMDF